MVVGAWGWPLILLPHLGSRTGNGARVMKHQSLFLVTHSTGSRTLMVLSPSQTIPPAGSSQRRGRHSHSKDNSLQNIVLINRKHLKDSLKFSNGLLTEPFLIWKASTCFERSQIPRHYAVGLLGRYDYTQSCKYLGNPGSYSIHTKWLDPYFLAFSLSYCSETPA